ncbi:MAG: DUF4831 family protein [Acidobacteria bacterium]|nr:DUF4831 family protein [Acidobacteriota bacterium]
MFTALFSLTAISCVSRINVGRVTEPVRSVALTGQNREARPAKAEGLADAKEFQLTPQAAGLIAKGGLYYALPRTRIAAEVAVEREIFLPGKLERHAPACLGLAADEIETQPAIKYSIAGGTVATNPEPDPA